MIDTKFTKGEWSTDGMGIVESGTRIVCDTYMTCKEDLANANLIKASPKMYKMLESVIGELHMLIDEVNDQRASRINSQTETEPDYHDMETLHNIQVLLAEARGEL